MLDAAGGLLAAATSAARAAPESPLNAVIGEHRRYAMLALDLDDHRRIRKAHGGTVNDVVLATVAGALRAWLLTRGETGRAGHDRARAGAGERPDRGRERRVRQPGLAATWSTCRSASPAPVMRLHQVSYRMQAHKETGQAVGATALAGLAGFAPPTLHSLGARVASGLSKRWFNLVVTNVPGPQQPLYAGDARMLAAYPVVPLAKGQALTIGLTSYDGRVFYGLNADRDAMPDVDVLAQCLGDALAELLETVR